MKKRIFILTLGLAGVIAFIIYGVLNAFGPVYDQVELKQQIGGVLICNSVYTADQHSWIYTVNYTYQFKGRFSKIGQGAYYGRPWKKDEQLVQFKQWTILKTGGWIDYDQIIVGDLRKNKWTSYEFSPDNIEKDTLWQAENIKSLPNYCCGEVYVNHIRNGEIELNYKFRTSETLPDRYDERKIYYQLDSATGKPILIRITKT